MPDPFLASEGHRSDGFHLRPLTDERLTDFRALLAAQAHDHASGGALQHVQQGQQLFKAIVGEKRAEAFLVIGDRGKETLAAVTYYDCVTEDGKQALYLEDIITAPSARRSGAGKVAMAGLAQIARQRQADSIVWECALDNVPAQNFYDRLGCKRETDRHTWRLMGPVQRHNGVSATQGFLVMAEAICVPERTGLGLPSQIGGKRRGGVEERQMEQGGAARNGLSSHGTANPNLIRVTLQQTDGDTVGKIVAYRNFSTFRVVNGLHIEAVAAREGKPQIVAGLLERVGETQRRQGWHGHTDITVRQAQEEILRPVLERYGFAPLAYGRSRMATHSISGDALRNLAERPSKNIIHRLTQALRV